MSNRTISAALATAFAASLALASAAQAADEGMMSKEGMGKEKCFGISTAGHNDCASDRQQLLRRHHQGRLRQRRLEVCSEGHMPHDRGNAQVRHDEEGLA